MSVLTDEHGNSLIEQLQVADREITHLYENEYPPANATAEEKEEWQSKVTRAEDRRSSLNEQIYDKVQQVKEDFRLAARAFTNLQSHVSHGNRFETREAWEFECSHAAKEADRISDELGGRLRDIARELDNAGFGVEGWGLSTREDAYRVNFIRPNWDEINS